MSTSTVTYQGTKALAVDNGISPLRCGRCRNVPGTGLSWQPGYDDGRDPRYLGFQCLNCGNIQGMTRGAILRRIRAMARRGW